MGWTQADVNNVLARRSVPAALDEGIKRPAKYRNHQVTIDGIAFDSKKEGEHYLHLKMRQRLNEIRDLELQPVFKLYVEESRPLAEFTPDFRYWERMPPGYVPAPGERTSPDNEVLRVVDVKSTATKTEAYNLRKKWCEDLHKVKILEV